MSARPPTATSGFTCRRIALVSPKGPLYRYRGGIFRRSLRYAPLTLTTLAALVPEDLDLDVVIIDESIEAIDDDLNVDLVAMTVITGTAPRAYELSARFRARGRPVVLGGPHVTLVPHDAIGHADAIVVGYAEESWPRLLRDFASDRMRSRYDQDPGLSIAGTPFPRRDLLPRRRFSTTNVFEATRGCSHDCDFCVVPSAWGRSPLRRPVGEVVADIRQHGARKLIFIDLNLIAHRGYAAELFAALIPLRISWYGLATVLIADDIELLDLARRSGCRGLLIGLESIRSESLAGANKGFHDPQRYPELTRLLHEHGIALMGCFVFGFDGDTRTVFQETAEIAVSARIDLPRFAVLTPFPGTALYRRLEREDRIMTRDWEKYDGQHVVFRPQRMSADELQAGTSAAWRYAYRFGSIAKRIARSPAPLTVRIASNLGYRYYGYHLDRFYNCDWIVGRAPSSAVTAGASA
ncbi:MAG: B12-binding domain-containing radical SAM protein [Phycisphaeraceae bacterium]|nr:B12-binding domain-containing radical SAM protein [Phycisphaeraceae bacterium]